MEFMVHQRVLPDGDLRSAKALEEEFWQWIVWAKAVWVTPVRSRRRRQPEMILDWSKIKRLRLRRGICEIGSKIVACLSQDSFVVCLMPVLAQKYGPY